jgi:methionyl-tRNA formyltransferase
MGAIKSVVFIGSKELGLAALREIRSLMPEVLTAGVTIDHTPDSRSKFGDFKSFTRDHGIKLCIAEDRKHSEMLVKSLQPDMCLVVGWYWLISKETLEQVPRGFLGIHNSLLPRYRGCSPLIWAILNEEQKVGVSLFSFTPGIDDGPVWGQKSINVQKDDYIGDVLRKLTLQTTEMLRECFIPILQGTMIPIEQDASRATYCAQRCPDDGNIDWHKSRDYIYRFIRAQSEPYPGAFTYLDTKLMRIWRAVPRDGDYFGTPGQIANVDEQGVYVICGDNKAIILETLEIEGRREKAHLIIRSKKSRLSAMARIGSSTG